MGEFILPIVLKLVVGYVAGQEGGHMWDGIAKFFKPDPEVRKSKLRAELEALTKEST